MHVDWAVTQVVLKQARRVHCAPGWTLSPLWSERLTDCDLWFICEGRGEMHLHGGRVALRPGMCFWMRPGGIYHATQSPRHRLTVAYAHFDLLEADGSVRSWDKPLPPELLPQVNPALIDQIHRRIVRPLLPVTDQSSHVHDQAAQALFRALLMDLDEQSSRQASLPSGTQLHHQQLIERIAMAIREHPGDDHQVHLMARQAGYSPDHFTRVFRQVTGQSPQQYAVAARITHARELLLESSLSVSQIADILGYQDVHFFSRQFKSRAGVSPMHFRHHAGRQVRQAGLSPKPKAKQR